MSQEQTAVEVADLYSTLNMIHPFREGNGRTQRIYFRQWARHLGFDIDFSMIDTDQFMVATIHASQGVMDGLINIFSELIEPKQELNMDQTF